jgi:hypothetical protein
VRNLFYGSETTLTDEPETFKLVVESTCLKMFFSKIFDVKFKFTFFCDVVDNEFSVLLQESLVYDLLSNWYFIRLSD